MATKGCDWLLSLSRCPRKHRSVECLWATIAPLVAAYLVSPQSATCALGSAHSNLRSLASSPTRSASLSRRTFSRHSSKVGAVCVEALVRICAGGGQRMIVPTASDDRLGFRILIAYAFLESHLHSLTRFFSDGPPRL